MQKLKPGHHPDPFRDKAKTSDNLCPQMRFIIHGEGQEQRPPVLTQPSYQQRGLAGTVAKLAMRQPFVLFKGLTFQKLCLPGAFRPGDHHNK
ncbi:hypothetical protein ACJ6UH_23105, partial [Escherichia coli]|uniref:hypothetical protein n=2 Tax=Escherichia coli TaxID=562 RepID=UPI003896AA49